MAEILPEDSGIIRCICDYDHDDNFTIQCERCNAWQHATCVNIDDEKEVPDNYVCPECSDQLDKVDRERARAHQRRTLQQKMEVKRHQVRKGDDEHEEIQRKRPGRKRNADIEAAEIKAQENNEFTYQYFVIPSTESTWTPDAKHVWSVNQKSTYSALPLISVKERRSQPSLRIVRHKTGGKWIFGIGAGAVISSTNIPANRLVCEVVGEVMLRSEYCAEPTNQFQILGCPKYGVYFVPGTCLAIDTRRRGSQPSLFLRRSARPNARLVTRRDNHNKLRVFVYSLRTIKPGAEISLGWHWPPGHPIMQALENEAGTDMKNQNDMVKTICWLLETDLESCKSESCKSEQHTDSSDPDEDWRINDLESHIQPASPAKPPPPPPPPSRPLTRAHELALQNTSPVKSEPDPGTALSMHVWVPATMDVAPPPKKRMSLKDYMRKRT